MHGSSDSFQKLTRVQDSEARARVSEVHRKDLPSTTREVGNAQARHPVCRERKRRLHCREGRVKPAKLPKILLVTLSHLAREAHHRATVAVRADVVKGRGWWIKREHGSNRAGVAARRAEEAQEPQDHLRERRKDDGGCEFELHFTKTRVLSLGLSNGLTLSQHMVIYFSYLSVCLMAFVSLFLLLLGAAGR